MLFNYFRTWFRNVIKYRTYAAINLLGLGIGDCVLLSLRALPALRLEL